MNHDLHPVYSTFSAPLPNSKFLNSLFSKPVVQEFCPFHGCPHVNVPIPKSPSQFSAGGASAGLNDLIECQSCQLNFNCRRDASTKRFSRNFNSNKTTVSTYFVLLKPVCCGLPVESVTSEVQHYWVKVFYLFQQINKYKLTESNSTINLKVLGSNWSLFYFLGRSGFKSTCLVN